MRLLEKTKERKAWAGVFDEVRLLEEADHRQAGVLHQRRQLLRTLDQRAYESWTGVEAGEAGVDQMGNRPQILAPSLMPSSRNRSVRIYEFHK